MLSRAQKNMLLAFMDGLVVSAGSIDSRILITLAVQVLSPMMAVNRNHAAGMLSALKSQGRKFTVIQPGAITIISS